MVIDMCMHDILHIHIILHIIIHLVYIYIYMLCISKLWYTIVILWHHYSSLILVFFGETFFCFHCTDFFGDLIRALDSMVGVAGWSSGALHF